MKPILTLLLIFCLSCSEVHVPKPKAFLNLEFPEARYQKKQTTFPFSFDVNTNATVNLVSSHNRYQGLNLVYPQMNATVFVSYNTVNNNITTLLLDAQEMTKKHMLMAEEISEQPYQNHQKRVFGMLFDVKGNAASPTQFYLTDSTHHFLSASLYFNTKPNYDSIMPAVSYIRKDIVQLIESIEWAN